jgi:DNA-binding CsgD family transcriptional regulator
MTTDQSWNELLIALHEGMHEEQLWSSFLTLLKERTGSDYASLIFLQGDVPMHEATELFVGRDVRTEGRRQGHEDLFRTDPIRYRALQSGKVYRINELIDLSDPVQARFRQNYLARGGVRHSRYMRVGDPNGVCAWAIILRDSSDFGSADEAVLSSLASHLAIAVRNFALFESARFHAIMGERALRSCGICMAAFDKDGRFISADPQGHAMLTVITGHAPALGRRLMPIDAATDRKIIDACAEFAERAHALPRVANIGPPYDVALVLVPYKNRPLAGLAVPATMALWRAGKADNAHFKPELLVRAFGFSQSEARLAITLLQGSSIAEAAQTLGLTVLTARQYSKALYAKAKVSGQASLIRKMLVDLPM